MWLKLLIVALLLFVIINLFRAFWVVVNGNTQRPASFYLGRRVFYSALILFLVLLAVGLGYLPLNPTPH